MTIPEIAKELLYMNGKKRGSNRGPANMTFMKLWMEDWSKQGETITYENWLQQKLFKIRERQNKLKEILNG